MGEPDTALPIMLPRQRIADGDLDTAKIKPVFYTAKLRMKKQCIK